MRTAARAMCVGRGAWARHGALGADRQPRLKLGGLRQFVIAQTSRFEARRMAACRLMPACGSLRMAGQGPRASSLQ